MKQAGSSLVLPESTQPLKMSPDTEKLCKHLDLQFTVKNRVILLPKKPKEFANDWMLDTDRMNRSVYKEAVRLCQGTFLLPIYHIEESDVQNAFPEVTFERESFLPIENIILDLEKSKIIWHIELKKNLKTSTENKLSEQIETYRKRAHQMCKILSHFDLADRFSITMKVDEENSQNEDKKTNPKSYQKTEEKSYPKTDPKQGPSYVPKSDPKNLGIHEKGEVGIGVEASAGVNSTANVSQIIKSLKEMKISEDQSTFIPCKTTNEREDETRKRKLSDSGKRQAFIIFCERMVSSARFRNSYKLERHAIKQGWNSPESFCLTENPEKLIDMVKTSKSISQMNDFMFPFAPDKASIFRLTVLSEAKRTGISDYNIQQKIKSETNYFMNLIEKINEKSDRKGIFIKNTDEHTMKDILHVRQGERFQFDWLFCSPNQIVCIEVTSGKEVS